MKGDDPAGRDAYRVSHDSSDNNSKCNVQPKIIFIGSQDFMHESRFQKSELKTLEEINRIKHKNVLFYFFLIFLASLLVAFFLCLVFSSFFGIIICGFLILIFSGVSISYFIRKPSNDNHTVLKLFSEIANNFLDLFRRF